MLVEIARLRAGQLRVYTREILFGHPFAVVFDCYGDSAVLSVRADPDIADIPPRAQTVLDGVVDDRLNAQFEHAAVQHVLGNVGVDLQPAGIAVSVQLHEKLHMVQLVPQRHDVIAAPQRDMEIF